MNGCVLHRLTWLWLLLLAGEGVTAERVAARELAAARARLKLVRSPEVQSELSLDPSQRQAIPAALEPVDLPLWQLRDLPLEEGNPRAYPLHNRLKDALSGVLRPGQVQRLDQLVLRLEGWRTLQLPSVVDQLELTPPQTREFAEFMAGFKNPQGRNLTLASLGRAEADWIQRVLAPAQRDKLGRLLGRPFDFSRCRMLEVKAPEITGVDPWINSSPLKLAQLRGKVVVVNFWTYGCINCIRNLPHYRKWHAQLPRDRVVMIGFHTPETKAEYDVEKVIRAVKEKDLDYPIAVDNQKENWNAWGNSIWPSVYLVDKHGYVRNWWYGELNWQGATGEQQMLKRIHELVAEKEEPEPSIP
jgi:thiol-disulfide isomerase/thioredoxin